MFTKVGLDQWNAPEVLKGESYTEKVDLWGVGLTLYYILSGENPFLDNNIARLHQKIVNCDF